MSNEPDPIYYALNVNLFAFTLQSGSYSNSPGQFNEPPETFKDNYEKLIKQNFSSKLNFTNPFPELRQDFPKSDNYDLLNSQKPGSRQFFSLSSRESNQNPTQPKPLYRLVVYPQKLSDNYSLLINVFRPQSKGFDGVNASKVSEFNPNQCLTFAKNQNFFGETLLITAYLSQPKPSNAEALITPAETLLHNLLGFRPDFYQADTFLDSYIVEFSRPKTSRTRYLVLFYFAESTSEKLKTIYYDLPELLLYYHKITNVFQQSRECADELDKLIIEEIESKSKLPESLDLAILKNRLKDILKTVPKYTSKFRDLEDSLNTLNIHTRNYQLTLKRLQAQANDPLDLFNRFAERESQTFLLQIQADLNYSKPGAQLLDQAIASIRGLVEIDQAESDRASAQTEKDNDRKLENTIQSVGTGIGVGIGFAGILASSYPLLVDKPMHLPSPQYPALHPFVISVTVSCILGGSLGWLAWWCTRKLLTASSSTTQIQGSAARSLGTSHNREVAISQETEPRR
jgi:hypothetical protein